MPTSRESSHPGKEPTFLAAPALQVNSLLLSHRGSPFFPAIMLIKFLFFKDHLLILPFSLPHPILSSPEYLDLSFSTSLLFQALGPPSFNLTFFTGKIKAVMGLKGDSICISDFKL